MTRKIIFIIIGALLFLALLGLLWFWFLQRSPAAQPGDPSGFGTSTDRTAGTASTPSQNANNAYAVLATSDGYEITPPAGMGVLASGMYRVNTREGEVGTFRLERASTGRYSITPQGTAGSLSAGAYSFTTVSIDTGSQTPAPAASSTPLTGGLSSGAWVGSGVSTREFTPAQINQINSTAGLSGTPLVSNTPQPAGLGTSGLILGITAAACAAQWAASEALAAGDTAARTGASVATNVLVFDLNNYSKQSASKFKSVEDCLVKTIAKAAIDQITRSVVTWINSGFNGQPSFVQNFNQYFANVADQAAGEFIKGSALSFLCSPFAPQIKIAIAQSYANRNNAASCSLSKVTNNINGFMRGGWGSGGWGSFLQFTTVPTNNPYGAYAYAQLGLHNSIANAQTNANRNVSPGGFISLQKCDTPAGPGSPKPVCKVTTPGAVIEDSLKTSLGAPIQGLSLAQNINDIISALTNQVMIKALQGGLGSSLSGITNPLAPAIDQAASQQAQALLSQLQSYLSFAGQYASVQQGSIVDIQNAQAGLNTAYNCWSSAASSSQNMADQTQAAAKAAEADQAFVALGARIDAYNNEITSANASLAFVQNLQSQVLFAATPDDVTAVTRTMTAAAAQGAFFGETHVTTAQQNRATLQTELAARNQATQATLAECRLFNGRI